jgi:hypothetical protein
MDLTERHMKRLPTLREQPLPLDDPRSTYMFAPGANKPLVATRAAIETYGRETILACLAILRSNADRHHGLDYAQVFESDEHGENLWFIEDGPDGAITALLPSDY